MPRPRKQKQSAPKTHPWSPRDGIDELADDARSGRAEMKRRTRPARAGGGGEPRCAGTVDDEIGVTKGEARHDPRWPGRERAESEAIRDDPDASDAPAHVRLDYVARPSPARRSTRTSRIAVQYGVLLEPEPWTVVPNIVVPLGPGRIVLFLGPSGSGKSSALSALERQFPGGHCVQRIGFARSGAIVDGVARSAELSQALSLLNRCALGEANLWVRRFDELSDGEKFRAQLARAIGLHLRGRGQQGSSSLSPLICDEFCSTLHRRAAKAISFNLRKLVTRDQLSIVLACSNEDVVTDLQPDTIVWFFGGGHCEVEARRPHRGPISFRRRLVIERGSKRDYVQFSTMHYRASDELGFVDKVFVLRDSRLSDLLGIVVYSHGPVELALRNRATGGRFSRNVARLNRQCRILRRLVIHPDVRGCGLGHYLVRKTLPQVGTPYVECLAAMGEDNPVFEKAGMTRIGQCELSKDRKQALEELRRRGVDPFARDFPLQVCRRRRVREIVSRVVYCWYQATTAGGKRRVARQSPELLAQTFRNLIGARPVYYLWRRPKGT